MLRVWHMPQIGSEPFYVPVESVEEAWNILNTLWNYDVYQLENEICKTQNLDFSGIEEWDEQEQEWREWRDNNALGIVAHFESLGE